MTTEKELLRQKIIEFQQTIAELKLTLAQKEELFDKNTKDSFLGLLDIMDAFETLENNLETKKDSLEIVKKGYINTRDGIVLRKTEVITVLNDNF